MAQDFILTQTAENGKGNSEMESLKQKDKNNCFRKNKFKFVSNKPNGLSLR